MKILVIDDHPLVSEAMRGVFSALGRDVQILPATCGDEGLRCAREHADLNLVVLDLMLPGMGGMVILNEFRRQFGALPVLMLSPTAERETMEQAIRDGAAGFITNMTPRAALIDLVRRVLAGEIVAPTDAVPARQARAGSAPPAPVRNLSSSQRHNANKLGLTLRETQVLERLLTGDSNKHIGEALGLAESTVKAHCSNIFRAMRVGSRSQVLSRVHQGLLDA
jgi:DNA-binding NarL/FixJ family response regulator